MGFIAATVVPLSAWAQLASTGNHYGSRATDTGYAGAVNAQGDYGASVPLDFPGSRSGLPVPAAIVYGGARFGAAGVGWDVPLSFVRRDTSVAHRLPVGNAGDAPVAREQLTLSLNGQSFDLVSNADGTAFVPRRDGPQLQVLHQNDGSWVAYDGNGRTYTFTTQLEGVASAEQAKLASAQMFLLQDITGSGADKVHLNYTIATTTFTLRQFYGQFGEYGFIPTATGLAIDLARVSYNPAVATSGCYKNQVVFGYDTPVNQPPPADHTDTPQAPFALALSTIDSQVIVRQHKLVTVDVKSKAVCGSADVALRTYQLTYSDDVDTGQARLQSVTMIGQEGTAERSVTLPVATYAYGSVSDGTNVPYAMAYQVDLKNTFAAGSYQPSYVGSSDITHGGPSVGPAVAEYNDQTTGAFQRQTLLDMTGDGRPDLIYTDPSTHEVVSYRNLMDGSGNHVAAFLPSQKDTLTGAFALGDKPRNRSLDVISSQNIPPPPPGTTQIDNRDMTWRQTIDFNGDGRLDIVDASEVAGSWVVYLNLPFSDQEPHRITWVRHQISIAPIVQKLQAAGFQVNSQFVPLSFRTTGRGQAAAFGNVFGEGIFTRWKLMDINGDGYPDLVFDSDLMLTDNSKVKAMLNVGGSQLGNTEPTDVFSGSIDIAHVSKQVEQNCDSGPCVSVNYYCGVESVQQFSYLQRCGFVDVNGDGLPDRVTSRTRTSGGGVGFEGQSVYLNTGKINGQFALFTASPVMDITDVSFGMSALPGVATSRGVDCSANPSAVTQSKLDSKIADVNGDGIPDLITNEPSGSSYKGVHFGTGAGFGPSRFFPNFSGGFFGIGFGQSPFSVATSVTVEDCAQSFSRTELAAFDMDGDGHPEVVVGTANGFDVYAQTSATHLAAGRLIKIGNGYGAVTRITYDSAKDNFNDAAGSHQLPFPEIVVSQVVSTTETVMSEGVETFTPLSAPTQYAYTGAQQQFDPVYQAWRFPGYLRTVQLTSGRGLDVSPPPTEGVATITDTYGRAAPVALDSPDKRVKRYLTTGRLKDVTVLSGTLGTSPKALVNVNVGTDTRRISGTHYDWDAKRLPPAASPGGAAFCYDMAYPYFASSSRTDDTQSSTPDQCMEHGFAFQTAVDAWRGDAGQAPPSTQNVHTRSEVDASTVDSYGRVGTVRQLNDTSTTADDLSVATTYAAPSGSGVRVLNAVDTRDIKNSSGTIIAHERFEYDTQPGQSPTPGAVSSGFLTAHVVSRLDENGAGIPDAGHKDIRTFDAQFDANGNVTTVTAQREDGATRTVTAAYEPIFGITPTSVTTQATNADATTVPSITKSFDFDPLTLALNTTTDANNTVAGHTYDGFGRVRTSTVKPPGGTVGALSSITYLGFAQGETGGRRIQQKVFTNPVAPSAVDTAVGRSGMSFFDQLGRKTYYEVALGADYANKTVVVGARVYDLFGRERFVSDPYSPADQFGPSYGTTNYFNLDGTLECSIRGSGIRPLQVNTDESNQIYPTCYDHFFQDHKEFVDVMDAAAASPLTGPQVDATHTTVYDAMGRLLESWVFAPHNADLNALESDDVTFGYDALGRRTSMARYLDPTYHSSPPVTTQWHYDSLGEVREMDELGNAPQFRNYSNWGELTQVQWTDTTTATPTDRRSITRYDALGRIVHREDQTNQSVDAETVNDFTYDVAASFVGRVSPTFVSGRMASASWPGARVSLGYDALGRINAQGFDTRHGDAYIERHTYNGDGSVSELHLQLPDNGYKDEVTTYAYDSAGRPKSADYSDGTSLSLFAAANSGDMDVFGRLRHATYGQATFTASYADTNRREILDVKVASPAPMSTSREFAYTSDYYPTAFDPVGRERSHTETKDGNVSARVTKATLYDAFGRVVLTQSNSQPTTQYTYDLLGNIKAKLDNTSVSGPANSLALAYPTSGDLDRICSIAYGSGAPPSACSVKYDGVGNILQMPTRNNGTRNLTYFANGSVKQITDGNNNVATFGYDAFGAVQALDLTSTTSPDTRTDRHYGTVMALRNEVVSGTKTSVRTRTIPVPGGTATRHGVTGVWTFAFGDRRGNRFFTDQSGQFVQDVDYQAYGESIAATGTPLPGAVPGSQLYTSEQWNGSDLLAALGINQLGARMYDPVLGRFLSRDPLFDPGNLNSYAFAANDPINHSDPSGMGEGDCGYLCEPPPPAPGGPGGINNPCLYVSCGSQGGGSGGRSPGPAYTPPPPPPPPVAVVTPVPTNHASAAPNVSFAQESENGSSSNIHPYLELDLVRGITSHYLTIPLEGLEKLAAVTGSPVLAHRIGLGSAFATKAYDAATISKAAVQFLRDPSIATGAEVALEINLALLRNTGIGGQLVSGGVNFLRDTGVIYPGFLLPSVRHEHWLEAHPNDTALERFGADQAELFAIRQAARYQYYASQVCTEVTTCESPEPPIYGPEWPPVSRSTDTE